MTFLLFETDTEPARSFLPRALPFHTTHAGFQAPFIANLFTALGKVLSAQCSVVSPQIGDGITLRTDY